MPSATARVSLGSIGALAALALTAGAASAVEITVNGQMTNFNPPPIERAGRVYVPLRGVFQALGASVVYQSGIINATGNGKNVSLKIGSSTATVDGQPQQLDSPPFIVGASTYVPLRFVSQALGAGVNFNAANQVVSLTTGGGAQPAPMQHPHVLGDRRPAPNASVGAERPTISGNFTAPVDPGSVHITLDGRDVTSAATVSTSGYVYAPQSPLQSMRHTVVVTGTANGSPFQETYGFTSGSAPAANVLSIDQPADGSTVGSTFDIVGTTEPNARVHVVAGSTANLGGVFQFGTGSYTGDTIADGAGHFKVTVPLQTVAGATIGVTVTSTDPQTSEAAQRKLRLHVQ